MTFLPHARSEPAAELRTGEQGLALHISGAWTLAHLAALEERLSTLAWPQARALRVEGDGVTRMNTSGAWLLHRTLGALSRHGCRVDVAGLRPEVDTMLRLIAARGAALESLPATRLGAVARIGQWTLQAALAAMAFVAFIGETTLALLRVCRQPRRMRWRAILHNMQVAGVAALPITGLLSLLMGIVIAYQGADQLQRFGANIFVADLVGISMLRELSPLLTAIIVAGRSGSAYTAQIGTMKVTEEIDALRTIGVPLQELLVLPKLLALIVVLPLLTVLYGHYRCAGRPCSWRGRSSA
jgi:phospholipid/cholesterol/gamma-HCH transport system permease protein